MPPLSRTDPRARPPARFVDEVLVASVGNVLAGLWLVAAPSILSYAPGDPAGTDVLAGAAIATLAAVRVATPSRWSWLSWSNAFVGAWLLVSALLLARSETAAVNEAVVGTVVLVLASLSAGAAEAARRRGGS